MAKYDKEGNEIPDNTPVEVPLGYRTPPTLEQRMQAMIRSEAMAQYARAQGAETFDEANDFDVDDEDGTPESPHELDDQEIELKQATAELEAARRAAGPHPKPPAKTAPAAPQPTVEAKPGGAQ